MNLQAKLRTLLAVVALAAVGASSFAADPPEGSPSVVASAIRLRDKLPPTAPPLATDIVVKEGALELTTQAMVAEQRMVRERVATSDGRVVEVERVITAYRSVPVQQRVDAKSVKVFQVTKDGTLKAHDTKPAELFAKASVSSELIGISAAATRGFIRPATANPTASKL